jgi:uncharacterized protein (TIGR00730 family)
MLDVKVNDREDAVKAAEEVLNSQNQDLRTVLHRDLVLNALKCQRDGLDILDLKILNRAISEFRHAACAFKPYRHVRKVSIFGSARVTPETPEYQQAFKFGQLAAQDGFMVITGGSGGIMGAGIAGAGAEQSFGVTITLPSEKGPAKTLKDDPKLINFKYFFTRKLFFVMEADAVALFPGGFGTHDEGFEVLTLLQTGKAPPMPVVLLENPGDNYWETWDQFIRLQMLTRHLISKEDLSFYKIVDSPEAARDWIKFYYSTYHSLRQVGNTLVIRLEKELLDYQIQQLNEKFSDLLETGKITRSMPLAEESGEPELLGKPRLCLNYNKRSTGRLNELILDINRLGRE